jgi:hypothetical protein
MNATFACSGCGNCCSTWQVSIDKPRAEALLALPWVQTLLATHGVAFEPLLNWGYYLPLQNNQMCVFWEAHTGCLIHTRLGATAKPLDCQRFPFASFTPPNANTFVDASFACSEMVNTHLLQWQTPAPSTIETTGLTACSQTPEAVSPFYPKGVQWQSAVARWSFPFKRLQPIPWNVFHTRLEQLKPAFQDTTLPLWTSLALAWRMVISPPNQQWLPETIVSWLLRYQHKPSSVPPTWVQQLVHRWVLVKFLRMPYGMFDVGRFLLQNHYADEKIFGAAISLPLTQVLALPISESPIIKAFLFQMLNRRLPLGYGGAWAEQWLQACVAWFLIQWYARALAWLNAHTTVEDTHIKAAIRLVERFYTAHQPRFLAKFEGQWFWLAIIHAWLRIRC